MPGALVNNSGVGFTSGPVGSPVTLAALGWTPVVGNWLYVGIRLSGNASATQPTVTDNINGTYTALGTWLLDGGGATSHGEVWKVQVATASAPTLTIAWTGGNAGYTIIVWEVSGTTGENVASGAGNDALPIGGSVSPSGAGILFLWTESFQSAQTFTTPLDNAAGNAMTLDVPASGTFRASLSHRAGASAGTYQPRITEGTASEGWAAFSVFALDSTGGSTNTRTATPITVSIAGTRRIATPVTVSLSTQRRIATPVTVSLSSSSWTTIFSDPFTRADSDTVGGNWVETSGDWDIVSNAVRSVNNASVALLTNTSALGTADYQVTADITATSVMWTGARGLGVMARYVDTNNYYLGWLDGQDDTIKLYVVTGGTFFQVGAVAFTPAVPTDPFTLYIRCEGSTISTGVNGAQYLTVNDTDHTTEGDFGLRSFGTDTFTGHLINSVIVEGPGAAGPTTSTRTATPITASLSGGRRIATPVTAAITSGGQRVASPNSVALSLVGQRALPVADGARGGWTTQAGGTTNLFATLDEASPDDSDFVRSSLAPVSDVLVLDLAPLSIPLTGTRTLSYRYGKDAGTERVDLLVELLEGSTVVQSWTHTDIPVGFTQADQVVTGTISLYVALHVRLTASQV